MLAVILHQSHDKFFLIIFTIMLLLPKLCADLEDFAQTLVLNAIIV